MEIESIKKLIESNLENCQLQITGDGHHFQAIVISPAFTGKNPVQRQQLVYKALNVAITSGELHAISLKTYTPEEWHGMNQ